MRKRHVIARGLLWLFVFITVAPLMLCLINAFKTDAEIIKSYLSLPTSANLVNFKQIIEEEHYFLYFWNSVKLTIVIVLISFIVIPFMSFIIVDSWEKRFYRLLYMFLCASMFIPRNLILFPLIKRFYSWNLMNELGVITYYTFMLMPETVFLLTPLFRKFGQSQKEAAMLDGCSYLQYYFFVFVPICLPFQLAITSLNCISIWNSFFMPLMILNKAPSTWTVPIFVYNFLDENNSRKNVAFATCLLSLLPMLLVYLKFHKSILHAMGGMRE